MDWKQIVKGIAPVIGGALGGPFGGVAAKVLSEKLLGKPDGTEEELENYIVNANPEQLAELKKIDNDFKVRMRELGFKEEELHVRDRESAREMAKVNMKPQVVLSVLYTLGYIFVLGIFLHGDVTIAASVKAEFNMVLGVLTAAQVQIMNFWFGSSSGSKQKTVVP